MVNGIVGPMNEPKRGRKKEEDGDEERKKVKRFWWRRAWKVKEMQTKTMIVYGTCDEDGRCVRNRGNLKKKKWTEAARQLRRF